MRQFLNLAAVALVCVSTIARAQTTPDWTLLGSNAAGHQLFIDRHHAVTHGRSVRLWLLYDYPSPHGDPPAEKQYKSVALYEEIQCEDHTIRSLAVRLYAENMGQGKLITSTQLPDEAPEHPPADSGRAQELDAGCQKDL